MLVYYNILAPYAVKSPHERLAQLLRRAGVRAESVKRIAAVALTTAGVAGEIEAEQLQELTGYSRKTVDRACRRLVELGVLAPVPRPARGRGHKAAFTVTLGKKHCKRSGISRHKRGISRIRSSQNPENRNPLIPPVYGNSKHSKDADASGGVQALRVGESQGEGRDRGQTPAQAPSLKRSPLDYQGPEASQVTLIMGARFYRYVMKAIRLGLEEWALSESVRDALEGFFGNRIDGASLAYARQLRDRIWALRAEIERLAASGASPRRVCSFVAGKLASVPERRSRREVLKRTDQLLTDVEQIERRIAGLRRWLSERVTEFKAGLVCARCGYRHSPTEYRSGYRDDGTGALCCFGFARIKLDELHEAHKLAQRRQAESSIPSVKELDWQSRGTLARVLTCRYNERHIKATRPQGEA